MWRCFIGLVYSVAVLLCDGANTIDCIQNTGGGCLTTDCFGWRGTTECSWGMCMCTGSQCAGLGGVCGNETYRRVGQVYKIRNVKWPEYYLDVDVTARVDVEKKGTNETDNEFHLYSVGETYINGPEENRTSPVFLLASARWPESVLSVDEKSTVHIPPAPTNNGEAVLALISMLTFSGTYYTTGVKSVDGGGGGGPTLEAKGLLLTTAPTFGPGKQHFILTSYQFPNQPLYIPPTGWRLKVPLEFKYPDPAHGGYWTFEPPLPADIVSSLRSYNCTYCPDCTCSADMVDESHDASSAILASSIVSTLWTLQLSMVYASSFF